MTETTETSETLRAGNSRHEHERHERHGHEHHGHEHHGHEHHGHDCGCDHTDLVEVSVLNCKTNDIAHFAVTPTLTLARMWQMAYDDLGETRGEADTLEDHHGTPLDSHLNQTVQWAADHLDDCLRFQIHGEQGGA